MSFVKDPDLGLFDDLENGIALPLEDGQLHYYADALNEHAADNLMRQCLTDLPWRQDNIWIAGKSIPIPRLQCWLGDSGTQYSYSNLKMSPQPWPSFLCKMKAEIEHLTSHSFNSALANFYRDGRDSVDWHSDDEAELGDEPIIASLSLGASRVFELKHRVKKTNATQKILLRHGSVLVMKGTTQRYWQHRIAKLKSLQEPRINITFRKIVSSKVRD